MWEHSPNVIVQSRRSQAARGRAAGRDCSRRDGTGSFLGAIGHPDVKPGILEAGILLKTRFALDQYINLRPVKLYPNVETPLKDKGPEYVDFVVVRENTGGIYTGIGGVTQRAPQQQKEDAHPGAQVQRTHPLR